MTTERSRPTRAWRTNLFLLAAGMVVTLILVEVGGRLLVRPCEDCWGTIIGVELPPFALLSESDLTPSKYDEPFDSLVVDGTRITVGDLWGIYREDSLLGYAPVNNVRSINAWYITNGLGARSERETSFSPSDSTIRVLAFGDSFGAGSRVRGFETWSSVLEAGSDNLEVVNFAVDGYSLAQAYLRYRSLNGQLDYDRVLVIFPPNATLSRDINVYRNLFDWGLPLPVPRFKLNTDSLKLVRSPYWTLEDVWEDNHDGISKQFQIYLRDNDAYYFRAKFESPPLIGASITYKLVARIAFRLRERSLRARLMDADSEAMQVSKLILQRWAEDSTREGSLLRIAFMPDHSDMRRYRTDTKFRRRWDQMVESACPERAECMDMIRALSAVPAADLDTGYDGTHYGPRGNTVLAEALKALISE